MTTRRVPVYTFVCGQCGRDATGPRGLVIYLVVYIPQPLPDIYAHCYQCGGTAWPEPTERIEVTNDPPVTIESYPALRGRPPKWLKAAQALEQQAQIASKEPAA